MEGGLFVASTVAAIATPNAAGAIGIVKISGPEAVSVASKVFTPKGRWTLEEVPGYTAVYGTIRDLDEAICIVYRAPRSYTGEDVVELQCHGGLFLMQEVLRLVLEAGAEPAGPGEFTKRAFLNGKMDLSEAESVMQLIGAHGEQAANAAYHALEGTLSKEIRATADSLIAASAHMAAWTDYPDEDVEELETPVLRKQLTEVRSSLAGLCNKFHAGQAVTEGVDTVIVGRPNVGKSTLMNLLLGRNRSIVTEVAGTTRDIIEETATIGNVVLRLSDTAGIHESEELVESIGIEMAKDRLDHADLVLAVFDGSRPLNEEDRSILESCKAKSAVAILNKSDLDTVVSEEDLEPYVSSVLTISAKDPSYYDSLKQVLENLLGTADFDPSAAMLANVRQLRCVQKSMECIDEAIGAIDAGMTLDAINVCVDASLEPLLELTGEKVSDTVIAQVFENFCVGK